MSDTTPRFNILLVEDEEADAHLVKVAILENRILADLQHVHKSCNMPSARNRTTNRTSQA